ncbi:MAG: twin-arginine translocation signal domain-containing protein [Beijerinckiaceae bacterium]
MERRGFLKLLGLGAVTAAVASTVGLEEAQAAPVNAPAGQTADQFLDELVAANKGDGEFAQRYYRRVYRVRRPYRRVYRPVYYYRRPVYYARPRRCRWVPGIFGPVWRCW